MDTGRTSYPMCKVVVFSSAGLRGLVAVRASRAAAVLLLREFDYSWLVGLIIVSLQLALHQTHFVGGLTS